MTHALVRDSTIPSFNPASPILVLAPHLQYPTRNGADIAIDRMWTEFSRFVPWVVVVGRYTVRRYVDGGQVDEAGYENKTRSRSVAGLRTLIYGTHYLLEANLTSSFRKMARSYLDQSVYSTVVLSPISTAAVLHRRHQQGRLICLETLNDEVRFYRQLAAASRDPFRRMVAKRSMDWVTRFLSSGLADQVLFLHVSDGDRLGYSSVAPKHTYEILPIGVDDKTSTIESYPAHTAVTHLELLFVGSLRVQHNLDALRWFGTRFYPPLKDCFGSNITVHVAGSNPTKSITTMCRSLGWQLHQDPSDIELEHLYRGATFSFLPFSYTTGVKLKLLETLAAGVPCLATKVLSDELGHLPYPCLVSDDPMEWIYRVQRIVRTGISRTQRVALAGFAKRRSWREVAANFFETLNADRLQES